VYTQRVDPATGVSSGPLSWFSVNWSVGEGN